MGVKQQRVFPLVDDEENMDQQREDKKHIYYCLVYKVKYEASKEEVTFAMK